MIAEPRQHDIIRSDNEKMLASLRVLRRYFRSLSKRKLSEEEKAKIEEQLDHLEHVLEFSASWNGVPTADFFPDVPEIQAYLSSHDITRLGKFFKTPFSDVSVALHAIGAEYPFFLRKMFETYYLHRSVASKAMSLH